MNGPEETLHLLFEDQGQIRSDCFVKQLHDVLAENFSLVYVSREQLVNGRCSRPSGGAKALSILKLRNWRRLIPFLAPFSRDATLLMYEQDPWEAYHDEGSSRGSYSLMARYVAIRRFLVTSSWWADFIAERDGLPTGFVRMGAVKSNCDVGPPFERRPHRIGFQGTVHPHRRAFFDKLREAGVETEILPRQPFETFLRSVQQIGIFVHDDDNAILVDGKPTGFHGLWGTCMTVAARGCFVIRNDDLSRKAYGIDELPTVFPYRDVGEIPAIIRLIEDMPASEKWRRMTEAVETIARRNDWMTVVDVIRAA